MREAVTLSATISIHNPRGYRTWHCNTMEAGAAEADLPTRDFWHAIMVRCSETNLLLMSSDLSLHTFPHIPLDLPRSTYGMPSWCGLGVWHRVLQGVGVFASTIPPCTASTFSLQHSCTVLRRILYCTTFRHWYKMLVGTLLTAGVLTQGVWAKTGNTLHCLRYHASLLWRAEGSLKMPEMQRAGTQQLQRL